MYDRILFKKLFLQKVTMTKMNIILQFFIITGWIQIIEMQTDFRNSFQSYFRTALDDCMF